MNTTTVSGRKQPLVYRLPVISHFRTSVGLQRGMLVTGLVLTVVFLLTACFAPLDRALRLCPAQRRRRSLPGPAAPSPAATSGAPRWVAMTSSPA